MCEIKEYCNGDCEKCDIAHKIKAAKAVEELKAEIIKPFEKFKNKLANYIDNRKGNKKMKIKLDDGAKMPTRAHENDAGLDLYARETQIVPAKESAVFDTGVHIELPAGTVGMLKSKSGLNVIYGLTSEGVIDVGYNGAIRVKLYNNSGYDYTVNAGDKISQLVIMPILTPPLELVESLDDTERGAGGFGSTGK